MRLTTNPVLAALALARMRAAPMFAKWAELNAATFCPAAPADVAQFVSECASLGIERLWRSVQDISKLHVSLGFADPTLGDPVAAAISVVAGIVPPRSWPDRHKRHFQSLPYDLQVFMAFHEVQREKVLRRAQNEAAAAKKQLAACRQPDAASREEIKGHETEQDARLEEQIEQIRADIEAIITAKVEAVARESPGVPLGVIRNLLTARAPACPCAQYLELNG